LTGVPGPETIIGGGVFLGAAFYKRANKFHMSSFVLLSLACNLRPRAAALPSAAGVFSGAGD